MGTVDRPETWDLADSAAYLVIKEAPSLTKFRPLFLPEADSPSDWEQLPTGEVRLRVRLTSSPINSGLFEDRIVTSLPIGMYEYVPVAGTFFTSLGDGSDTWGKAGFGLWGLPILTQDVAVYRRMAGAIEGVLAGLPRQEVRAMLEDTVATAKGLPSPSAPTVATLSRTYQYPPLIQAVVDQFASQAAAKVAAERASTSQREMPIPTLDDMTVDLLLDFLYSPSSPLYSQAVSLRGLTYMEKQVYPHSPNGAPAAYNENHRSMIPGPRSEKRLKIAGASDPATFNPAIFTALTIHGSTENMSEKKAIQINAAHVLVRQPRTATFVRTGNDAEPFPLDLGKELKILSDRVVKNGYYADKYGKILVKRMEESGQLGRTKTFADAVAKAQTSPRAAPIARKAMVLVNKAVEALLKNSLS